MKLLQTKDYLLLIDKEAEIKYNTIIFESDTCLINIVGKGYIYNKVDFKIIAYYPLNSEAKELDLPLLPNPFKDVDIERLADKWFLINNYNKEDLIHSHTIPNCITNKNLFIEGYKSAQSKQLELLKRAIQLASDAENIEEVTEEIIQSLSTQQLPKEFVGWLNKKKCPYDFTSRCTIDRCDCEFVFETIVNSEGKEEIQGTYKY